MEVSIVSSDAISWTDLPVPAQVSAAGVCAVLSDCTVSGISGVGITSSAPSDSINAKILWRIHQEHPAVLELIELSCGKVMHNAGLRLLFEESLCPFASVRILQSQNSQLFVYEVVVISGTGVAYFISLNVPKSPQGRFSRSQQSSTQRDVSGDLCCLGRATSFAAIRNTLCVGGRNGSVVCFPYESENASRQDSASFELKDGESGLSRLWGLSFRGKNAGPVKCLTSRAVCKVSMLLALHEDGTLRIWDLSQRSRLFNQIVSPPPEIKSPTPRFLWVEDQGLNAQVFQLAFLYGSSSERNKEAILVCSMHSSHSDGQVKLTHLTSVRTFPITEGIVIDFKLLRNKIWILLKNCNGQRELHFSSLEIGSVLQNCQLQEAAVSEQLFHGLGQAWDDLLFALHHIGLDSAAMLEDAVPNLFLRRILQPGVRQNAALKEVLRCRRRHLTDVEISSLTLDGLRKEIKSSVISEGRNCRRTLQEWINFCNSYVEAWIHSSRPYGLFADLTTGAVGLIRKSSVSVIRSLTFMEQLSNRGTLSNNEDLTLPVDWDDVAEAVVLNELLRCTGNIAGHLGKMALGVFHEALLAPLNYSLQSLVASYLSILDVGHSPLGLGQEALSFGIDEIRSRMQGQNRRQRRFALHISQSLHGLHKVAGSWEKVLNVVSKYAQYLVFSKSTVPAVATSVMQSGSAQTKTLAQATCQISWTHFEASRNLIFLLRYIVKVQGHVGLTSSEVIRIQLKILPKVQEGLSVSLLLHWLTVNFAEVAPSEDCSLQLSSLNIDGSTGNKAQSERVGAGELSLAEVLAAAFLETSKSQELLLQDAIPNPDTQCDLACCFVSWLLVGESSDALHLTFSGRAITLSSILLQHGQYGSLENFLISVEHFSVQQHLAEGIASVNGEWSARLHLLGICLLARARSVLEETSKEKHIKEAIECFFRAATGLGEANKVLQSLFFVTGPQQHLPGRGAAAAWKLQYFEWVMQLFDQYSLSEGACQFAHAALEQVDEAVGVSVIETSENNSPVVGAAIKGRLWANVFKFSLDLEQYGNAYCAIISNPDEGSKDICLRRFIIVLCDHKASHVLCSNELPYGELFSRVEEELVLKAQNSDTQVKANLFKLLYALHMHHHNIGRAAGYIYQYALRAREEGFSKSRAQSLLMVQEELDGLAASINALQLVDSSSGLVPTKRRRVTSEDLCAEQSYTAGANETNGSNILDIEHLEKEHASALARLQLMHADVNYSPMGRNMPTSELIVLLLQHGLHETAFSLVFLFWKDSSLQMELEKVFEVMARNCCLLQLNSGYASSKVPDDFRMLVLSASDSAAGDYSSAETPISGRVHPKILGAPAAKSAWEALKLYVEKYWKVHPHIRAVVAKTILSVDRNMELPLWLIDTFKGGLHNRNTNAAGSVADPAALLRIYMDHDRFVEATYLLLEYIQLTARLKTEDGVKWKQACAVWFPYTLVDKLQQHLAELARSSHMAAEGDKLQFLLQNAVLHHFHHIKKGSDDIKLTQMDTGLPS